MRLRVGDTTTVTATYRVACPQLLGQRAALVIVGAVPSARVDAVRASLAILVETLAAAGGARVSSLWVGGTPEPSAWASGPLELAAAADRFRAMPARPTVTLAEWQAAFEAAETAVRALPVTVRPLLVVLGDASQESRTGAAAAGAALTRLVAYVRDAAGHSLVFDASDAVWMGIPLDTDLSLFGSMILVVAGPNQRGSLPDTMAALLAAFRAPLVGWSAILGLGEDQALAVIEATPQPFASNRDTISWGGPLTDHAAVVTVRVRLRAERVSVKGALGWAIQHARKDAWIEQGFTQSFGSATYCVDPPAPAPAQCTGGGGAPPGVTATASSTPTNATPLAPPAAPSPSIATPSPPRGYAYLPVAEARNIGRTSGASARDARLMRPLQLATLEPSHGLIGHLPQCEAVAALAASNSRPRVGEVITVTVRARVQCPTLLRSSAPLFVIGRVPNWAAPSLRDGLAEIVRAVGAAGDAPIAYRLVGDEERSDVTWAASASDRAKVMTALRLASPPAGGSAGEWTAALDDADRALMALPPRYHPLIVIVGALPETGFTDVVDRIGRSLGGANDMAGRGIVIDASEDGPLLERMRLEASLPGNAILVFATDHYEGWYAFGPSVVMAAFESPLSNVAAILFADSPGLAALSAWPPEMARPGGDIAWLRPASGLTFEFEGGATFRAVGEVGDVTTLTLQVIPGRDRVGGQAVEAADLRVCIAPADPASDPCAGPVRKPPRSIPPPSLTPTTGGTPVAPPPSPRRLFVPLLEQP